MAHGISIGVALRLRHERQVELIITDSRVSSAKVALRLRHERQVERLRTLLELSNSSRPAANVALLLLLLSGIMGGFMLNWWSMGWICVSLLLLVFISVGMMRGMSPYLNSLRKAVGSPYKEAGKLQAAQEPASADEIEALLDSAHFGMIAGVGIAIIVSILYLMTFKPF